MPDAPLPPPRLLSGLRRICLALPDVEETLTFGHPTWRVRTKIFCVIEKWKDDWTIVLKVGKDAMGIFLSDPRYFQAPYIGKHGWVSLRVGKTPDWKEIEELVKGSCALVSPAPKRKAR